MDCAKAIVPMSDLALARLTHLAAYSDPATAEKSAPVIMRAVLDLARYRQLSEMVRDLETFMLGYPEVALAKAALKRLVAMRDYLASDMEPQRES